MKDYYNNIIYYYCLFISFYVDLLNSLVASAWKEDRQEDEDAVSVDEEVL